MKTRNVIFMSKCPKTSSPSRLTTSNSPFAKRPTNSARMSNDSSGKKLSPPNQSAPRPLVDLPRDMYYEIWKKLPVEERMRLHLECNQKPTQFLTSGKMLLGVPLKTRRGLEMLVMTTGDLEPCVEFVKPYGLHKRNMEGHDATSRVDRIKVLRRVDRLYYSHASVH